MYPSGANEYTVRRPRVSVTNSFKCPARSLLTAMSQRQDERKQSSHCHYCTCAGLQRFAARNLASPQQQCRPPHLRCCTTSPTGAHIRNEQNRHENGLPTYIMQQQRTIHTHAHVSCMPSAQRCVEARAWRRKSCSTTCAHPNTKRSCMLAACSAACTSREQAPYTRPQPMSLARPPLSARPSAALRPAC